MRSTLTAALAGALALTTLVGGPRAEAEPAADSAPRPEATAPGGPAAAAGTAITLGTVTGAGGTYTCLSSLTGLQQSVASSSPSYTAPSAGVVTSFSYRAEAAGQVRALFFVPAAPGHYTLVAKSPLLMAAASSVNTYQVQIPVPAGAILGSRVVVSSGGMACASDGAAGDVGSISGSFDPDTMTDFGTQTTQPFLWNASAVLEPDADLDGLGDVSQDGCPQSALSTTTCPDTSFTRHPPKRTHRRKVTFRFASSLPDSSFQCSVDFRAYRDCPSPFKVRLRYGKHTVLVRSVASFGSVDTTPASVTFKIRRKRR
jgi:hypothetical protein